MRRRPPSVAANQIADDVALTRCTALRVPFDGWATRLLVLGFASAACASPVETQGFDSPDTFPTTRFNPVGADGGPIYDGASNANDTGAPGTGPADAGAADSGASDTTTSDTGASDTGAADTGTWDTGASDTTTSDTGAADTGTWDTGTWDTGAADTGTWDTGTWDTGAADTGTGDTGTWDTGTWDTGAADTGAWDADSSDSGATGGAVAATAGALVITEIHPDPAKVTDAKGEWFEVWNATTQAVHLDGLIISDKSGSHTVAKGNSLVIQPKGYFVFAVKGDENSNGGVKAGYVYSGVTLNNAGDLLMIKVGTSVIDAVTYSSGTQGWPTKVAGVSLQLSKASLTASANDSGTAWCLGSSAYGAGDLGSPGQPNSDCP